MLKLVHRRSTRQFRWLRLLLALMVASAAVLLSPEMSAYGVADDDKTFIEQSSGAQLVPFMYLGAKHMVTGYDHLLFLVGVIFFLYRLRRSLLASHCSPWAQHHAALWRARCNSGQCSRCGEFRN